MPVYIDLRLGNLCNFKCRMCNPFNSNSIAKEHFQLWGESAEYRRVYTSEFGNSPIHLKNQENWFESDSSMLSFGSDYFSTLKIKD